VELIAHFDEYVDIYDRERPFRRSGQYELHRQTIDRRRLHDEVLDAIQDPICTQLLHQTLLAWGIGKRASLLAPLRAAWEQFCRIAEATSPARLVGEGWRTSATKILDNAVVASGMR
jgi:hypothetical protein